MTFIKRQTDVGKCDDSLLPKEIIVTDKYVINLEPLYKFLCGLSAILLLCGGSLSLGCGISYADLRMEANRNYKLGEMAKANDKTAEAIKEQIERDDNDVIAWRNKAPLPPAGLVWCGLTMFVVGLTIGLDQLGAFR